MTGKKNKIKKAEIKSNTLGIELKQYKLFNLVLHQRNISWDYRIREALKKLYYRWEKELKVYCSDSSNELASSKEYKEIFKIFSLNDLQKLYSDDKLVRDRAEKKSDEFKKKYPDKYSKMVLLDRLLQTDTYDAMNLFITNRQNLKDLCEIMIEEDISDFDFEPKTKEGNAVIDLFGLELMRDFFELKRLQVM